MIIKVEIFARITLLLLLVLSAKAWADRVDDGLDAYREGDYELAFEQWAAAAEQDDPVGQYNLAVLYYNGDGVETNYKKAHQWFLRSAKQGYADAQYDLGTMYMLGEGTNQDYAVGLTWLRKSADQQYGPAMLELGKAYHHGTGLRQHLPSALRWYYQGQDAGADDAEELIEALYTDLFPSPPKAWSAEPIKISRTTAAPGADSIHSNALELERIYKQDKTDTRLSIIIGTQQAQLSELNARLHAKANDKKTRDEHGALKQAHIVALRYAGHHGMRFNNDRGAAIGAVIEINDGLIVGIGQPDEKTLSKDDINTFFKRIDLHLIQETLREHKHASPTSDD